MIDILYDHEVFATQRYGGVSRYFVELSRALRPVADVRARLFAPAYVNSYIEKTDALHPLSFDATRFQRGLHRRAMALAPLLKLALRWGHADILHETSHHFVHAPLRPAARRVSTLHDMTVERFPQWFDGPEERAAEKVAALERADAIICISEHTRQDLLSVQPQFASRCVVVHHGVNRVHGLAERPATLPPRYLLYVGTRPHYKNFERLVQALGAASRLPADLKLVCIGGGRLSPDEQRACARAGWASDRIVQVDGDDVLLASAYRHAELFVFPSLYEGFGMPLTEAMVQSCPIACSRASSFPEIGGDAVAYFDPNDVADMTACIEAIVLDPARRTALADAARRRADDFSWERCAEETLAVYRRALQSGPAS